MNCEPATTIIKVLGGLTKVARRVGVKPPTVLRWRHAGDKGTNGIIPAKHHAKLIAMAAEQGISIPLGAFVDPELAAKLNEAAQ